MNETNECIYLCIVCEESFPGRLTGGLITSGSMSFPMFVCPSCGPIHQEVMQMCREDTVRELLN